MKHSRFRPVLCISSLELVLAISHSYDILPNKLFPHYLAFSVKAVV